MNFARPAWPGAETATRSPASTLREANSANAARTSSTGSASGCESIVGYSTTSNASATSRRGLVGDTRQRSALRLHLPMSIPQTYGLAAMGPEIPLEEEARRGRANGRRRAVPIASHHQS